MAGVPGCRHRLLAVEESAALSIESGHAIVRDENRVRFCASLDPPADSSWLHDAQG